MPDTPELARWRELAERYGDLGQMQLWERLESAERKLSLAKAELSPLQEIIRQAAAKLRST